MDTCRTCTWLDERYGGKGGYCGNPKLHSQKADLHEEEQAEPDCLAFEGSAFAGVLVGNEFGCIHHTTTPDPFSKVNVSQIRPKDPERF